MNALNSCGATALCLDLIAEGIDEDLQLEAIQLGVGLLFKEGTWYLCWCRYCCISVYESVSLKYIYHHVLFSPSPAHTHCRRCAGGAGHHASTSDANELRALLPTSAPHARATAGTVSYASNIMCSNSEDSGVYAYNNDRDALIVNIRR